MLYFIGLGLYDEKDVSLKGLEALRNSDKIYVEFYTARLFGTTISSLEEIMDRKVEILSREQVEEEEIPLKNAETNKVAFLSAGDPLIATTHADMMIEAKKRGIKTRVIHSSSILSAAPGISGLQAYKFGKVTTIPFPEKNFFPHSPYLLIKNNLEQNAHTLVLLDIRAHEDRYMTVNQGLDYLLKVEDTLNEGVITKNTLAIGLARAGSDEPVIRADIIKKLIKEDFGGPLHSLIIPAPLHIVEAEYLVAVAGAPEDIINRI
ncbi:diphthine synthase [Methanobacterium alkalithermotolerans]|uniref:Diphthine synthase n=1 Tax=Methanobacterium alkalithermotolerans TaxID=2731220 RepID=A0A8T8K8G7_9EURY|nr:diphthine synthase [Methanobacterium alkalithermotolerans]QUH23865.1 diphthine synthase [Methanobacterium alkalithermotolerans]